MVTLDNNTYLALNFDSCTVFQPKVINFANRSSIANTFVSEKIADWEIFTGKPKFYFELNKLSISQEVANSFHASLVSKVIYSKRVEVFVHWIFLYGGKIYQYLWNCGCIIAFFFNIPWFFDDFLRLKRLPSGTTAY